MTRTVADKCRDQIVAELRDLGLEGVQDDEVVARHQSQDWTHLPRGISVVPDRELEAAGTNEKDDYGYVFGVYWTRGAGKAWDELTDEIAEWRRQTRITFNNKRLANVDEVYLCSVRAGEYLSNKAWQDNRAISALAIVCWSREAREE